MLEEGPILRTEVVTALVEAGIEKAEIEGIEAPRKNQYFIVFKTFLSRRANMGKSIRVREKNVRMEHPDPSVFRSSKKRVKIYNYPLDEDISHLEKTLQHYGSFNKDSIKDLEDRACGIKNGIKEVYVDVKKNIPSYVYIGKNLVGFNYIGQEETCRKCHQTGHFGRECTTVVTCRGCGGNDHYIQTCPKVICFQCGKQGHTATSCFHYEDEFPDLNGDKESDKDEENEGNGENTNQEIDLNKVTLPTSTLDRRPLSVRYQEYCSTAPEYSQEEAEGLIESLLEAENQLASSTHLENRTTMEFQQLFDHLKLDHSIAVSACRAANPNDPQSAAIYATWQKAEAALTTFEVDYPEIVKEAEELYGDIDPEPPLTDVPSNSPAETTTSSQAVFSASPDIPNGQPVRPHTENLSSTDNPSPPILPEQMETDRTESSTDAGSLKTSRRSRHKSRSTNNELASCVRRRTAPALPGVRKPNPSTPHPPDSPYTPLVTDSGYLVTDPPRGTPPTRPKRPNTGAVGAVSPSLSSDSHP